MDSATSSYTSMPYKTKPTIGEVGWVETLLKWRMLKHIDVPETIFSPLEEIEQDLISQGFTKEEIDAQIVGLSKLPEYANIKRSKRTRKRS